MYEADLLQWSVKGNIMLMRSMWQLFFCVILHPVRTEIRID
ncbi:MAG: hypothetical protein H6Q17_1176 [Bacteroidetes bacterium]|nr:hypothetical protein [Bacteroidota bacterium]